MQQLSVSNATYEERNYSRQPQRKKIFITGDSHHLTRMKKDSLRKKFKGDKVYLNILVEQIPNS